jgi:hypothetical protein
VAGTKIESTGRWTRFKTWAEHVTWRQGLVADLIIVGIIIVGLLIFNPLP